MDHLFGAGLGLLIIVALALTIWQSFFKARGEEMVMTDTVWFECQECKNVYEKPRDELTKSQAFSEGDGPIYDTCPECNKENYAVQMEKCPKGCGPYMPKGNLDTRFWGREGYNICSKCGLDVDEYHSQEREKRRKTKKK